MNRLHISGLVLLLGAACSAAMAGGLAVSSTSPAARTMVAHPSTSISVTFDRAIDPASVDASSFWAFGRWSGAVTGTYAFSNGNQTVSLSPSRPLTSGETVMVILSHDLQADDGTFLRDAGYSFQFWTRAGQSAMNYVEVDVLTTRSSPGEPSIAYGGFASDLDEDGFMDVTIVNEATADLRVFMNKDDNTGLLNDFLEPPAPVGDRASPNEPTDFNRDGHVDVAVCNIDDATVSVLFGNGDGTFTPSQTINVGSNPRGIAVLDFDGDGDVDFANTNSGSGNLQLHTNDGTGNFGVPVAMEGGGSGEWSLGAADMNEDGILDLIVGLRSSQRINVLTGNGNGTFTAGTPQLSGGATWMLVCGDVNGDTHVDIASANSANNNGSILLGDGNGNLGFPTTYGTDSFPLATDLADLDGDGDLDWITSSFGGDWFMFSNNGDGTFTFDEEFFAASASSCSLCVDLDNDSDLDLVLIDEVADLISIMINQGSPCPADIDGGGGVGFTDLVEVLVAWGPCRGCPTDLDGDGMVGFTDIVALLAAWGPCP